jgi:hypothetical protein
MRWARHSQAEGLIQTSPRSPGYILASENSVLHPQPCAASVLP